MYVSPYSCMAMLQSSLALIRPRKFFWFGLGCLFNGVSSLMGYFIPNQSWYYLNHTWWDYYDVFEKREK